MTGIRGLAACAVVLYHYFQSSSGFGLLHVAIAHSYIAVDLFFVLSGYVMALTYGSGFTDTFSASAYASFLGKRLGRVYPLYLAVTAAVAGLIYLRMIDGQFPSLVTIVSNAFMVQAWGFADSIGGPTWSISTEFAAYLAFPILVVAVLTGRAFRVWLAGACAFSVLILLSRLNTFSLHQVFDGVPSRSGPLDIYGTGTLYPLLRCFAGFVLGLGAYRLSRDRVVAQLLGWKQAGDLVAAVVLALWCVWGSDVVLELVFVPLIITLAFQVSFVARFVASRVVFWLGDISYSIYLVHRPVENLMRNPLKALLSAHHVPHAFTVSGLVPLALTFGVSAATFYGIEKPARNWSRRLMGARPRPIATEPAAP